MDLQGKYKPTTAIFIFSVIMFLAFTIAQIVQAVFFIPYVDFQELLESNGQMNVLKLMPANMLLLSIGASSAVMFIGGPLLYLKIVKQKVWSISKNDKVSIASFFMTLLLIVGFMPLNSFIFEMNSKIPFPQFLIDMENQMAEVTKSIMVFNNLFAVAIGVFVIGVLAGVGEELTFRGIFQNLFNKLFSNHHVGIWVTALIFTTIHMQFLGFFSTNDFRSSVWLHILLEWKFSIGDVRTFLQ